MAPPTVSRSFSLFSLLIPLYCTRLIAAVPLLPVARAVPGQGQTLSTENWCHANGEICGGVAASGIIVAIALVWAGSHWCPGHCLFRCCPWNKTKLESKQAQMTTAELEAARKNERAKTVEEVNHQRHAEFVNMFAPIGTQK